MGKRVSFGCFLNAHHLTYLFVHIVHDFGTRSVYFVEALLEFGRKARLNVVSPLGCFVH